MLLKLCIKTVVFVSILLAVTLSVMVYACRNKLPLPARCYAAEKTIMIHYQRACIAARPLKPAAVVANKYFRIVLHKISIGYRYCRAWVHKKWYTLMHKIDPKNEFGFADYDGAMKEFTRETRHHRHTGN